MLKRTFLPLTFLLISIGLGLLVTSKANAQELTPGSQKILYETRDVLDFSNITVSGSAQLFIIPGNQNALKIEAPDNIMPLILSEVNGDTLNLNLKDNSVNSNKAINYYVTVKTIKDIKALGSTDVFIQNNITAEEINLYLSGSGKADIKISAKQFKIAISGSGTVQASGIADEQFITISGSGDFKGDTLAGKTGKIMLSGSGNVEINTAQTLDVNISGYGIVKYRGHPELTQTITGSGEILAQTP